MKTPFAKSKKGFTIIEVSLVLAIGGLIMLMVFIAWPAVQRNQRDSQRRNSDLSARLYTALTNYMTNNKGKLPAVPGTSSSGGTTTQETYLVYAAEGGSASDNSAEDAATNSPTCASDWCKFYKNYLLAEGDSFVDPIGTPYTLSIVSCSGEATSSSPNKGLNPAGTPCTSNTTSTLDSSKNLLTAGTIDTTFNEQNYTITIVIGASCDGEKAVAATSGSGGTRKFAIMYRLESGGVYCQNN